MMKIRKWLEKRPTLILKEPLIKKLKLGLSPYHRYAFELGERWDKTWKAFEEKDAWKLRGNLTGLDTWAAMYFGIDVRDERRHIISLAEEGRWKEVGVALGDLKDKLIRELERFREPIVIRRIPIPR